jgi:HlyD family secretion protein
MRGELNFRAMNNKLFLFFLPFFCLSACGDHKDEYDAAGSFESVETIVSTEASGTLMEFAVEEGQTLKAGQEVGYVDSAQLHFRREQLEDQIEATRSQMPNVAVQVSSLQAQLEEALVYQQRIQNLYKQDATTRQTYDDANTKVKVLQDQIAAMKSSLGITSSTLLKTVKPLQHQIDQVSDQLSKCRIINPVGGVVLTKYAENHEVVGPGKALYKIAEVDTLILRAYITGAQLDDVKLNQQVSVRADEGSKKFRNYTGKLFWISDKAEFTPKTIPTKEERADLVYAVKIRVKNDGFLKIGMYGEVKF